MITVIESPSNKIDYRISEGILWSPIQVLSLVACSSMILFILNGVYSHKDGLEEIQWFLVQSIVQSIQETSFMRFGANLKNNTSKLETKK